MINVFFVINWPQKLTTKNLTWMGRMDRIKEGLILNILPIHVNGFLLFEKWIWPWIVIYFKAVSVVYKHQLFS